MARRRPRVRRFVLFCLALTVLIGLLELNQWLPGSWPGGGGEGGFREVSGPRPDVTRVRPALGRPFEWPQPRVRITVRRPGGEPAPQVRVRLPGGPEATTDGDGRVEIEAGDALARGFTVETPDGSGIEHGPALPGRAATWEVVLPDPGSAPPPREDTGSRTLEVRVVAPAPDGGEERALAGAHVRWRGWTRGGEATTDAEGRVLLTPSEARVHVVAEAPGHFLGATWADVRTGTIVLHLLPRPAEVLSFVDAVDGTPVDVEHLRLLDPQGEELFAQRSLRARGTRRDQLDLSSVQGGDALRTAILEVGGGDRPVVRMALADATDPVRLPRGRPFPVLATDARGGRLADLRLEARYVPPVLGRAGRLLEEPVEVSLPQRGPAVLPEGVAGRILVEAGFSAPRAIEIGAEEPPDRRTVRLAGGGRLTVRVEDLGGASLPRADVVVVAVVDGARVVRRALTDSEGRATLGDLPRTWAEVYAHARGHAWQATTVEVGGDVEEVPLSLTTGSPLRLVVETAAGLPVEGVRVRLEPEGPPPLVVAPDERPARTDAEGTATLLDLPDRPYRVRLSGAGYREAVLHALRPGETVYFATLQEAQSR